MININEIIPIVIIIRKIKETITNWLSHRGASIYIEKEN